MNRALAVWRELDAAYEARTPMPSMRELCAACGLSSTSVARYNLDILEREGIITRAPGKARSITLEKRFRG